MKIINKVRNFLKHSQGVNEVDIVFRVLAQRKKQFPPPVMIDVGAHFGGSLGKFARSGWQVYAFEPDDANRERLVQDFGNFENISIEKKAVADEPREKAVFFTSEVSTGISGLSNFHESHKESGVVEVTTLAQFIQEKGIEKVDFLKIDAEGYDLFVLKGCPWGSTKPDAIVCEFEDSKTIPLGYRFEDICDFLRDKGYYVLVSEWYPIVRYGISHRWRRFGIYPCSLSDKNGWGNLIACADAKTFADIQRVAARTAFIKKVLNIFRRK